MPVVLICLMLVYTALSFFVWRYQGAGQEQAYPIRKEFAVLGVTLLVHGISIWQPVIGNRLLVLGFGYALSLMVWLVLMLYFAGSFFYRLRGLQLLLYPVAALLMLPAAVFPGHHAGYQTENWPFILHVTSSLLAYGLFTIAALVAVLILWLSGHLHKHKFSPLVSFLPPLLSLEKMMFQSMWVGFALLTISVTSGTFFSENVFGVPFQFTHKTVFGIISWFIYAGLLLKRSLTSWRGKKVAIWTIIGFMSLVLAYFGSKFVLEVILHR